MFTMVASLLRDKLDNNESYLLSLLWDIFNLLKLLLLIFSSVSSMLAILHNNQPFRGCFGEPGSYFPLDYTPPSGLVVLSAYVERAGEKEIQNAWDCCWSWYT